MVILISYSHFAYGIGTFEEGIEGTRWTQQDVPFGCVL